MKSRRVSGLPVTIRIGSSPRVEARGDLAREVRDRVDRLLARAGVVERAGVDDAQAVRVGVEARRAGPRRPSRPRTGSAGAAARPRSIGQRLRAARTPRPSRPTTTTASGASSADRLEHVGGHRDVVGERAERVLPRTARRARGRRGGRRRRARASATARARRARRRAGRRAVDGGARRRRRRPRPRRRATRWRPAKPVRAGDEDARLTAGVSDTTYSADAVAVGGGGRRVDRASARTSGGFRRRSSSPSTVPNSRWRQVACANARAVEPHSCGKSLARRGAAATARRCPARSRGARRGPPAARAARAGTGSARPALAYAAPNSAPLARCMREPDRVGRAARRVTKRPSSSTSS